jgi:phospholipase A1
MKKIFIAMCLLLNLTVVFAKSAPDLVEKRMKLEKRAAANPFLISFYKPNYILPFYYNFTTPYLPLGNTIVPDGQKLNNTEFKFQLSFKVPLWREIAGLPSSLYLAYTQSSFWQSYGNSPFFRETNYEPELFLANNFNYALAAGWHLKTLNLGMVHQSNGRGGDLERSWNRIYLETTMAHGNWMLTLKPWYVTRNDSLQIHNADLIDYLGHGQLVLAYKYGENTWAVMNRNSLESGFKRGAVGLSWSYPMLSKIKGYVQFFSGYGQSLIGYDHYSNSIGIGLALSDWI